MTIVLSAVEARVLGALVEKEATTPEYYPLSLNALVNACNQKNNRDPEMHIDEQQVRQALHRLEDHQLAAPQRGAESRVVKYEHRLQEVFNFTRGETSVLCVLLLRGPQTPGELRGRTERIFRFEELDDVLSVVQHLMDRFPPLVTALPRRPGTKEIRYAHLLSGEVTVEPESTPDGAVPSAPEGSRETPDSSAIERLRALESEVAGLRLEVARIKEQIAALHNLPGPA